MTRHLEASNAYMDEGVALLTLARKAHGLFESAHAIENVNRRAKGPLCQDGGTLM